MKCPLFDTGKLKHGSVEGEDGRECLKEECAWWDKNYNQCGLLTLAMASRQVVDKLGEISWATGYRT